MNSIVDKIQKLLNLAGNNPSEAEAQAALLKAQELMAKHNIEQNSLGCDKNIKYSMEVCKSRVDSRRNQISAIIARSFAVKPILYTGHICFFGYEENAKAAASCMDFITKVLRKGIRKVCAERGLKPHQSGASLIYNAYSLGFIKGLKDSMDAQTVALAVVVPQDVKDEFNKKFPNVRNVRSRGMTYGLDEGRAYETGYTDGSSVLGKRSLNA